MMTQHGGTKQLNKKKQIVTIPYIFNDQNEIIQYIEHIKIHNIQLMDDNVKSKICTHTSYKLLNIRKHYEKYVIRLSKSLLNTTCFGFFVMINYASICSSR